MCPLCGTSLMYKKNQRRYKHYEIAHIYPLNPTTTERELLAHEEKLSSDPDHLDNLIPLCVGCHKKFDKPRTVEEYRELVGIKKALIVDALQKDEWGVSSLQDDVITILNDLMNLSSDEVHSLSYDPKEIDKKLNHEIKEVTKTKIKFHVSQYYNFIYEKIALIDKRKSGISDVIFSEVRSFYAKQKLSGATQQKIYEHVVGWIISKTHPEVNDAAEILAAFFIQNCEVFE